MNKRLLNLYHRSPPFLWPLFSSLQAYRLRKRRYGDIYRAALADITQRTNWSRESWQDYQNRQLSELLNRASELIHAYRGNAPVPNRHETQALQILSSWPLLDVDNFRQHPERYCDPVFGTRNTISLFTSGSTGTPKKIIRDSRAEQLNYAYTEVRWRNSAGVKLGDRWAMIGGQLIVPVERNRPPFWVKAYPMQQLYLSSYHLQMEYAEAYMTAIKKWQPTYIIGYASSLHTLARFAEKTNIRPRLKCILSNAEPLYDHVRHKLEQTFDCEVRDTYGATEGAFMGFECRHNKMHVCPDFGVFEILRNDGTPCAPGELGRAVVTGLTNCAMPLIRYPTGDTVAWSENQQCNCGCSFPIINQIEGRTDDLIVLPNGRLVGRLDPVFKDEFPISEAQIVQRADDTIEVRVVVADDNTKSVLWDAQVEQLLMKELRARLGQEIPINIRLVDRIPRDKNNKFKAVVRERD